MRAGVGASWRPPQRWQRCVRDRRDAWDWSGERLPDAERPAEIGDHRWPELCQLGGVGDGGGGAEIDIGIGKEIFAQSLVGAGASTWQGAQSQ